MVLSPLRLYFLLFLLLLSLSPLSNTSLLWNSSFGNPLLHISPPAAPAMGPILQQQPFIVVWNMPTARCQRRYNVHLKLRDFDIVKNHQQKFQGQKMTIFYRDRLGKYPYLSQDGRKVNGGIPQLGNLSAHLHHSVAQMSSLFKPNFAGLAVIDWEEWHPLWERNFDSKKEYRRLSKLLVRQERPDLSGKALTLLAKQRFEESARRFMGETLRTALRNHPKGHWGFYGFPACINKHKRKTDRSYTGRCRRGTRRQNDRLSWLWSQSTALYPSIYLPQRLAGSTDASLMVRYTLLEALRVASPGQEGSRTSHSTPVFSYAKLTFIHTRVFLNETDLMHTLGESASLGAAGVVLWGELKLTKSKHQCILLRDYIQNVLGPFLQSLKSDTQNCSHQLCHGNGRCTRRHPTSGHMVSSGPAKISDPHGPPGVKHFRDHFTCRCYPGWTGQKCQQKAKNENSQNILK